MKRARSSGGETRLLSFSGTFCDTKGLDQHTILDTFRRHQSYRARAEGLSPG